MLTWVSDPDLLHTFRKMFYGKIQKLQPFKDFALKFVEI